MGDNVCLECECPIEASAEQRIGEGLRSCRCTTADLRNALDRAYRCISEQGERLDALAGETRPEERPHVICSRCGYFAKKADGVCTKCRAALTGEEESRE